MQKQKEDEISATKDGKVELDDHDLIVMAIGGNSGAFDELCRRYNDRVYSLCLSLTGNATESDEIRQEVFLRIIPDLQTFIGCESFGDRLERLIRKEVARRQRSPARLNEFGVEDVELVSALRIGDPSRIKEEEIIINLKSSSPEEIRLALEIEEVQKSLELLESNSVPIPKLLTMLRVLLEEVRFTEKPISWTDVWASAIGRRKELSEIKLAWREAANVAMSGELTIEIRDELWSCMKRLSLASGSEILSYSDNEELHGKKKVMQETASEFLSFLHGLIKAAPSDLAQLSPAEDFLRDQFIDFSRLLGREPTTLMLAISSFVDEVTINNRLPAKDSLKAMLALALITPKAKRQGLIDVLQVYLN